ncbi:MAG: PD40 domain-containing protein [Planctomycetes bacterium]|nr:PD40 domain-containing protein [Planctomycetota bacterium]
MSTGDLRRCLFISAVLFLFILSACAAPEGEGSDLAIVEPPSPEISDQPFDGLKPTSTGTSSITPSKNGKKKDKTEDQPVADLNGDEPAPSDDDDDNTIKIGQEEDETKPAKIDPNKRLVDTIVTRDAIQPGDITISPEQSIQVWTDMKNHSNINYLASASHPAVSLDGSILTFSSNMNTQNYQIYMRKVNAAISNFVQITSGQADHLFPSISPDSRSIAFCSNKNGNFDIFVVHVDNPVTQMQLTFSESEEISPSWSPDGKQLVYCFKNQFNVWQLAVVDVSTRIVSYLGPGMFPKWSPNKSDNWIVYQAQPTTYRKTWGIWIVKPDGTNMQQIVSDPEDKNIAFNPNWSPDGNWVVYAKSSQAVVSKFYVDLPDGATADLYIIKRDGTNEMHLTETQMPEWAPAWGGRIETENGISKVINDRIFFASFDGSFVNVLSVKPPIIP